MCADAEIGTHYGVKTGENAALLNRRQQARRRLPSCIEFEDIHQSARLGLVEAATRFDADRGTPFAAYARKRVYGAAIEPFRRRFYRDYQHIQFSSEQTSRRCDRHNAEQ